MILSRPLLMLALLAACSGETPSDTTPPPVEGTLRTTVAVTGAGTKPTTLVLHIDDRAPSTIPASGAQDVMSLPAGVYWVRAEIPGQCVADHYAPRQVEITGGEVSSFDVSLRCPTPIPPSILFQVGTYLGQIWVAELDGSSPRSFSGADTLLGTRPVANPARTRIAYSSQDNTRRLALHLMDADGSHDIMLPWEQIEDIDWSPDGSRLIVSSYTGVHMIWADGVLEADLPVVTRGRSPRWSPDGSRIAYNEGAYSYIRTLATGARVSLTNTNVTGGPAWSPDGTQVAYLDGGGLHVVDADGNNQRLVSVLPNPSGMLDWGPDGRLLLDGPTPWRIDLGSLRTVTATGGTVVHISPLAPGAQGGRWAQ